MVRPATESRRMREAARGINVYLSSARNRAIESGRRCGVTFHVAGTTSAAMAFAMTADQCEEPVPYCGSSESSVAAVKLAGGVITASVSDADASEITTLGVSAGDFMQLNYQGPLYQITNIDSGTLTLTGQSTVIPWTSTAINVPYRIMRLPMSSPTATTFKGAAEPLQLPVSTVVDFTASGTGSNSGLGSHDVTILFGPDGSVARWYLGNSDNGVPTEPIYLLIGKRGRMLNTSKGSTESTWTNYQDLNNLWIVINPQTGMVMTESVGSTNSPTGGIPTSAGDARGLAQQAVGMGGR